MRILLLGWLLLLGLQTVRSSNSDPRPKSGNLAIGANRRADADTWGPCDPQEVHLMLTEDPSVMRVVWRTTSTECPTSVRYGDMRHGGPFSSPAPTPQLGLGSSYHITADNMCSAPAKKDDFRTTMHSAVMTGLEAGQQYWYQPEGDSGEWSFTAPQLPGSRQPFSFMAVGDMGEDVFKAHKSPMAGATAAAMRDEIIARPVDLVLHIGDLAYADGKHKIWDSFMSLIEPIASRVPYMVGVGNHEYDYKAGAEHDPSKSAPYHPDWGNYENDSGGECGAMVAGRFIMPSLPTQGGRRSRTQLASSNSQNGSNSSAGGRGSGAAAVTASGVSSAASASGSSGRALTGSAKQLSVSRRALRDQRMSSVDAATLAAVTTAPAVGVSSTMADLTAAGATAAAGSAASGSAVTESGHSHLPPFWYSFDAGPVHFTVVSTEHDISPDSVQYDWLERDLESVDRCITPWLVVALHRPMYVVYPHKDNRIVGEHLRNSLEELLLRWDVDFTVAGHVHSYARSCSVRDGECLDSDDEADGMRHFIMGTGGHLLSGAEDFQAEWCDELILEHGFGRFTVDGDEMRMQFILSGDGRVADEIVLRGKVERGDACNRPYNA